MYQLFIIHSFNEIINWLIKTVVSIPILYNPAQPIHRQWRHHVFMYLCIYGRDAIGHVLIVQAAPEYLRHTCIHDMIIWCVFRTWGRLGNRTQRMLQDYWRFTYCWHPMPFNLNFTISQFLDKAIALVQELCVFYVRILCAYSMRNLCVYSMRILCTHLMFSDPRA